MIANENGSPMVSKTKWFSDIHVAVWIHMNVSERLHPRQFCEKSKAKVQHIQSHLFLMYVGHMSWKPKQK